jgi:hypothetical protein
VKANDYDKTKAIFERAIDNVGNHMRAADIWVKYIEFEIMQNHMGFMNLICYMALKTPLLETS